MTFAKSKRLLRDVKWLGRRMSLHSRYWTSCRGNPSAYLPGLSGGTRRTGLPDFSFAGAGRDAFFAMWSPLGLGEELYRRFSRRILERGDLGETAQVAGGLAVARSEIGLDQIPRDLGAHRAAAHAEDVHVVVLDALPRREVIVNERGPNAPHLVRTDRSPDSAPADRHTAIDRPRRDRSRERRDGVRIVVARIE